jgi:uncharacterized SAM-binding protein YcdF (DUF218 family)
LFKASNVKKLVFTGGKIPRDNIKKTEGEVLLEFAVSYGIPSQKIFVKKVVENTEGETVSVKELISPNKRIILVTSAYHMYRAKKLFEKQGFDVIPYNVVYKVTGNSINTFMDLLPSAGNLELSETGLRELLGRLFYLVKN